MPMDHEIRNRGKKIKVYKTRAGNDCPFIKFDIRMDDKGKFSANHLEQWYDAPTLKGLTDQLDEMVKKSGGTPNWTKYIEIEPVKWKITRERWQHSTDTLTDLTIKACVILLSDVIDQMGGEPYRLKQDVDLEVLAQWEKLEAQVQPEEGDDPEEQRFSLEERGRAERYRVSDDEDYRATLILYTPQRWANVQRIADAFNGCGSRLAAVLSDKNTNHENVTVLDDAGMGVLLSHVFKPNPLQAGKPAGRKKKR